MKNLKMMTMLVAVTTLTACDYIEKKEFEKERGDKGYQAAMADYSAGKLDAAVEGLKKVLKWNPSNSSARFQLACLQQDRVKDFCAAFSNYIEYLAQEPNSDKAQLAQERLSLCEKDLAKFLAKKHGIISSANIAEEYQRMEEDVKRLTAKSASNQKELTELTEEVANLRTENERLKKQFTSIGLDESDLMKRKIDKATILDELGDEKPEIGLSTGEIAALKGEEAGERGPGVDIDKNAFLDNDIGAGKLDDEVSTLKDETETDGSLGEEVAALREEEEDERGLDEAALAFKGEVLSDEDKAEPIKIDRQEYARKQAEKKAAKEKAAEKRNNTREFVTSFSNEEAKAKKPATYVVEEGDTLYKIAVKFYGRSSAWQLIREANKESVSTDGRVRVGQVLRLP